MEKIEIDRQLALAIGYLPEHVREYVSWDGPEIRVMRPTLHAELDYQDGCWFTWNHLDSTIIWPLAKHYKCFPCRVTNLRTKEVLWASDVSGILVASDDTPEEAAAMAIIKRSRK